MTLICCCVATPVTLGECADVDYLALMPKLPQNDAVDGWFHACPVRGLNYEKTRRLDHNNVSNFMIKYILILCLYARAY